MALTGQNIEIYQGKDKIINVTITDSNGAAFNIASCTFTYVVYKPTSGVIFITKTSASGISVIDETNGIIEITLLQADTQSLLGTYNHECEITTASSEEDVIFTGYFKVFGSKT